MKYKIQIDRQTRAVMRDGIELAVVVVRPDSPGTYPAIMSYNPYRTLTAVKSTYSEKKRESSIPIHFWYLSIFGGIGLLIYAISRKDPVIITGQMFGIFIYVRNLILIYKKNNVNKKLY